MKYQSLFSGKNKKNISKCCLVKFLPSMLSIKQYLITQTISSDPIISMFNININLNIQYNNSINEGSNSPYRNIIQPNHTLMQQWWGLLNPLKIE